MASKRRIRRKSCDGKIRHETSGAARKALWDTTRRDEAYQPMNVYRCDFCGGYHIGHRGKRGNKA